MTEVCASGLARWGDCVWTFLQPPAPSLATLDPCLLCPQPVSALPWEGLTLPSVQPAFHRMFPRRRLHLTCPPSGQWPPVGQDPGVQGSGGGAAAWGGPCQGEGMRVGGGEVTGSTGSASFLPCLSLPGCPPWAEVDRVNPVASGRLGGARTVDSADTRPVRTQDRSRSLRLVLDAECPFIIHPIPTTALRAVVTVLIFTRGN